MSIFDSYEDKESLLRDISAEITEETTADGGRVYRLINHPADAYKAKYDAEVKNARSQREKKQDLEARLAELTKTREQELVELEELRKLNPEDVRKSLTNYAEKAVSAQKKIEALEHELEPLRKQNAEFKAREERARIENELTSNAIKMNCSESALRDVRRLAPMFHLNEAGVATTEDGRLVVEVLQEEIAQSPHWLKRSQTANAAPSSMAMTSEARFREALRGNSFSDVLSNAPRQKVSGGR